MSDWLPATAWLEDAPNLEGDGVGITAELTDVDEVALRIALDPEGPEHADEMVVYLDRVHAIALAGLLAKAATTSQGALPKGHGADGPLV